MRWWPQIWQNCAAALIRSATWGTFLLLYICITFLIQALNKRHLLLTILDNTGEPVTFIHTSHLALWDNCRSEHLMLGCICSQVWWGLWWGVLFPEYKLEYCAAPGDISDRFAAPACVSTLGACLHCLTYISNYHPALSLPVSTVSLWPGFLHSNG